MREYHPSVRANKEMESRLGEHRLAKGLTVKELCVMANVHAGDYSNLNNGMLSPILSKGGVRPTAERLAKYLGASLSDLFPRYFCEFHRIDNPAVKEQMHSLGGCGATPQDPADIFEEREEAQEILRYVYRNNPNRFVKVMFMRLFGYSLAEVGEELEVSRERVRQMEKRCILSANFAQELRKVRRTKNECLV